MAKFDQYNPTFFDSDPREIIRLIERAYPFAIIEPIRPKQGYQVGVAVRQGGDMVSQVWWEGNPGVHVLCHSEHADKLAPLLRGFAGHEVTRVDACEDWIEEGLFDKMAAQLVGFVEGRGIKINQLGDWIRGQGRTLELGSRESAVFLRLYEKGFEIGIGRGGNPHHVRLEVEVKPKGRASRIAVSSWTAGECFGASRWLVAALKSIGWDHLQAQSIGTVYRPSDEERARHALVKQWNGVILRWADEAGSGNAFLAEMVEMLELADSRV